ncbi:hypothetical protein JVT61DRAFT_4131 [Boletus reticuloceps]|uniref:Uncharacterized protein n=1 Tax=Boletus reticuloceps TaxID=495285 RepID=A0A8I2YMA1_9AGAM|nr:hypothetical protein JVT61DRAFT_4131 [Boletus reticuloceps]
MSVWISFTFREGISLAYYTISVSLTAFLTCISALSCSSSSPCYHSRSLALHFWDHLWQEVRR